MIIISISTIMPLLDTAKVEKHTCFYYEKSVNK